MVIKQQRGASRFTVDGSILPGFCCGADISVATRTLAIARHSSTKGRDKEFDGAEAEIKTSKSLNTTFLMLGILFKVHRGAVFFLGAVNQKCIKIEDL